MAKQGEHGITWTNETWNPIRGCSRVSEGCRHCYAERVAGRFSGRGEPYEGLAELHRITGIPVLNGGVETRTEARWTGIVRFIPEHLQDPLRWTKPRMVFVNSMSDLFHENCKEEWIDQIFAVMALRPRHTFQVLTKRPERMREYMNTTARGAIVWHLAARIGLTLSDSWPLPNVWMGVSVEDQKTADERIPLLLQTPAAIRWVSYEPALGPVKMRIEWMNGLRFYKLYGHDATALDGPHLDWVVCGGESGPGARPMQPNWARSARDQCQATGVPFFFKQGSQNNWKGYKEFDDFPEDLKIREFPNANR